MEYRGGDTIIQAGQPISALFIVLSGNAVVKLPSGIEVARIGAGEILGEMSLVDRRPPSATVAAVDVTTLLAIDHTAITRKLDHDYGFAARMYRAIATFLSDRCAIPTPSWASDP